MIADAKTACSDYLSLIKLGLAREPHTKFINFFTPENNIFYSSYTYLPLDAGRREIRLVKVYSQPRTYADHLADHLHWAKSGGDNKSSKGPTDPNELMIGCEIVDKVPLSRVYGRYLALSYCAGSLANPIEILVNGFVFNVFANLYHAIKCALSYAKTNDLGSEILLWVDQICINQVDSDERSRQVGLMREIYRRCDTALVCLSTVADDPGGMNWARIVSPWPSEDGITPITAKHLTTNQDPHNLDAGLWNCIPSTQGHESLIEWLKSLRIFVTAPWWTRSWVYQEFVTAPRIQLLFCSSSMPWTEISSLMEHISSKMDDTLDRWQRLIFTADLDAVLLAMQRENDEKDQSDDRMCAAIRQYRVNLNEFNKMLMRRQSERHDEIESGSFAGREILQKKRDKIALGGYKGQRMTHLDAQIKELEKAVAFELRIQEDKFEADMEEIRQKWANAIIFPRSKVFTREAAEQGIAILREGLNSMKFKLKMMESMMKARIYYAKPSDIKPLLQHARNCQSSDPRDRVYAFVGLAYPEYELVPSYSWSNTTIDVFIETCQKIIEFDGNLSILEHAAVSRSDIGCFLPSWVPDWTSCVQYNFREECLRAAGTILETMETFAASKCKNYDQVEYRRDEEGRSSHLALKTKGVFLDRIGPYNDENNEEPIAPKKEIESVNVQRFGISLGYKVFTGRQAQTDDEVWILYGANWPVILRLEGLDEYSFLGEALVCTKGVGSVADIMTGSIVDEVEAGKASLMSICLV